MSLTRLIFKKNIGEDVIFIRLNLNEEKKRTYRKKDQRNKS